jgi:hypothetical protein
MTFLLLYLLATCDAAFCGYRAAAGRSALLFKRGYYLRAMVRGALWGQLAVALAGLVAALLLSWSPAPGQLLGDYASAGGRLLEVYLPYAVVIGLAFGVRAVPSVDLRSLASVVIFGPMTLLRPAIVVGGGAWAVFNVPRAEVAILVGAVIPVVLFLERFLARRTASGRAEPHRAWSGGAS